MHGLICLLILPYLLLDFSDSIDNFMRYDHDMTICKNVYHTVTYNLYSCIFERWIDCILSTFC